MKRVYAFVCFLCLMVAPILGQSDDEVLMTIGDEKVTVGEFLRIYNKNNNIGPEENKKSIEEYLDLFINFKLKVIEAENRGMDTLQSFRSELAGYEDQLAAPYLRDDSYDEQLMKEGYERMKEEVHVSHIMIRLDKNALPEDTLAAYNKIMNIRNRAVDGEAFEELAKEASEDPSAEQNAGDLGYFSAFRMVYPFETAAYTTPVGVISKPFRTPFGYHIIKVHDRRPSLGSIMVAHIMAATPETMSQEQKDSARIRILNVHKEIKEGADFGVMAHNYSDDRGSARSGGELRWFKAGEMVPEFEMAAFALENDGDVSPPIRTRYGWHIIKRLEQKGIADYEDIKDELAQKIKRDQRTKTGEEAFVNQLKDQYDFSENRAKVEDFYFVIDSSVFRNQWQTEAAQGLDETMFTINGKPYTQQDFATYIATTKTSSKPIPLQSLVNNKYEAFVKESVINYEKSKLPEKYPEFKYLMEEYHDGILLFDLTDQLVWSKAVEDSAGLEKYHEENKTDYMWGERVKAAVYTFTNPELTKDVAKFAKKRIRKGYNNEEMYEKICGSPDSACFKVDVDYYEKQDDPLIDNIAWETGVSDPINNGENITVIAIHEVRPPEPKKLDEARGLITADYQEYLEKKWIAELRNKYEINVHKDVLNELANNNSN